MNVTREIRKDSYGYDAPNIGFLQRKIARDANWFMPIFKYGPHFSWKNDFSEKEYFEAGSKNYFKWHMKIIYNDIEIE